MSVINLFFPQARISTQEEGIVHDAVCIGQLPDLAVGPMLRYAGCRRRLPPNRLRVSNEVRIQMVC